jgi:hypothetical protein
MATHAAIPRSLERYPLGAPLDAERWRAVDRDRGRDVTVTRVAFGRERRAERDAFVEDAHALYGVSSPALIAVQDAGPWAEDAFVVEERVVDPRPIEEAQLDPRERALAARAIAEGVAVLDANGWTLDTIEVAIDAYRQPKVSVARHVHRSSGPASIAALSRVVQLLAPGTPPAMRAVELARNVTIPDAPPGLPLYQGRAPERMGALGWAILAVAVLLAIGLALAAR